MASNAEYCESCGIVEIGFKSVKLSFHNSSQMLLCNDCLEEFNGPEVDGWDEMTAQEKEAKWETFEESKNCW